MIYCESIIQMFGTWHFILTLDDSTGHYIIATSAPLDLLKKYLHWSLFRFFYRIGF